MSSSCSSSFSSIFVRDNSVQVLQKDSYILISKSLGYSSCVDTPCVNIKLCNYCISQTISHLRKEKTFFPLKLLNAIMFSHKWTILNDLYRYTTLHSNETARSPSQYFDSSLLRFALSTFSLETKEQNKAYRSLSQLSQFVNFTRKSKTAEQPYFRTTDRSEHSPRNLPSMFCLPPILGKCIDLAPHIRETRQFR